MVCGQTSISDTRRVMRYILYMVMVCGQTSISDTSTISQLSRSACYGLRTDIDQ